ncbi:hypothetical protein H4Q26_017067, partial [Puccinia striiformis f. sp. tritici PST-130]
FSIDMASSLQALLNAIKNATTREQPARNVKDLEEEEEESEKEGNILTSTATGTSSNGDLNVGGLRRSTRAASKTPADPNISKGATVPTPDPTEHVFLEMQAPPSYVAGLGRGASGFTTRSDIGPAREGPPEAIAAAKAARGEEDTTVQGDDEQFQDPDNETNLFASAPYDQEDEEADKI